MFLYLMMFIKHKLGSEFNVKAERYVGVNNAIIITQARIIWLLVHRH